MQYNTHASSSQKTSSQACHILNLGEISMNINTSLKTANCEAVGLTHIDRCTCSACTASDGYLDVNSSKAADSEECKFGRQVFCDQLAGSICTHA